MRNKRTDSIEKPAAPHVLLLVESSRAYGRGCLMGIASYMRSHGLWNALHLERGLEENVPAIVRGQRFDGVIARLETSEITEQIETLGVPTVDLRGVFQPKGGVSFNTDPNACAEMAFKHFRERGFNNLGFCGYSGVDFSDERRRFFTEKCVENGLSTHVYQGSSEGQGGERSHESQTLTREAEGELQELELIKWMDSLPKPIGIFACNDVRGRQILAAAHRAGIRVPGQVAVLGVDDDEVICELANPPLSSIEPNSQRIGFEGAATLARLMADEPAGPDRVLIPPIRVAVRQSSDITSVDDTTVANAIEFIKANAFLGIDVTDVARSVSVSRTTLERRFRKFLSCTPREEIERVRVAQVKTLLGETDYNLDAIASMTGYKTASHLSITFRRVVKCTPGEYRQQVGAGHKPFGN